MMYTKFIEKLLRFGSSCPLVFLSPCLLVSLSLLASCARHVPEKAPSLDQALAKLRACAPTDKPEEGLEIAIVNVTLLPDETDVRIVAQAENEAIDFDLPTYSLSRGRWLINEKGRAYLLDEQCREYKLKDRRPSAGQTLPRTGWVRLNPGQTFEAILVFPRFLEPTRIGMMVYGGRSLSFEVGAETVNGATTGAGSKTQ